ncbi:tripartite tricarboxylate transporter substrate-binding protein [Nonomuraea harbinensis]|uniref:Tripartite tricarboxylate transporter substrate-binding protein n=1 Tax=Nonomuraea harbinensis TaxID=1286938 RepID=A0ABW1BZM8_9ACTN|nr:tripartite tricarboxylate transporter substrate-binding protein [Nonomuraea harbinensis]
MRRRRFLVTGLGVAACLAGCGDRHAGRAPGAYEILGGGERWSRVAEAFTQMARGAGYPVGGAGPVTTITITGLPALAAAELNAAESPLHGTTPLARLAGEVEVVLVPRDSGPATFDAFGARLRADPTGTPLAGGPQGAPDHLLFGLIARGLGADTRQVDYTGYPGISEVATALLAGRAVAATGPLAGWRPYIDRGRVRVLAVSCAERFPGLDAPSLLELGVRVDFASWCAAVGPGGMPQESREAAIGMCEEVTGSPGWQRTCREGDWMPIPLAGDRFAAWVVSEVRRTKAVLRDLGLLESGKGTT